MKRILHELPYWLAIGTRLVRICKCEVPTPGEYVIVRIGANRKMAWADHDNGGSSGVVIRWHDLVQTYGERYERAPAIRISAPQPSAKATP